jgi:hypothetical protein
MSSNYSETKTLTIDQAFARAKEIFANVKEDSALCGVELITDNGNVYFQKSPFKAVFAHKAKRNAYGDFLPL